MHRIVMLVLCLIGFCCGAGFAVEAVTKADFGNVSTAAVSAMNTEAHWIWGALASPIVLAIAGWLYSRVSGYFKDSSLAVAITAIKDAVTACYHEYVRAIKAASEDGKLTVEEKNQALNYAFEKAIEYARTHGVDLLKVFAKETVFRLIEKYVGEAKAPVPPPLPDLRP